MCQEAMSESVMDYEPIKLLYFYALYLDKSSDLSDNLQNMQMSNIALQASHDTFLAYLYIHCI